MEIGENPASVEAPGEEGGADGAQVGQVRPRCPGVSAVRARPGVARRKLGPRILLWESGFNSQSLPRRKAMEREGLRNFQELRAKFQNLDAPTFSGRVKFPASIYPKDDIGIMQPSRFLANGKPLSPNHHQFLAYCSSIEPQDLKIQKKAKRSEIKRYTNSLGPPEKCSPTVNSLLEENKTNAENTIKTKAEMTNSFQDKLWNWEMVSSQQSEVPPTFLLANGRRRVFHLEEQGNMGLNPEKSKKKVEVMEVLTLPSQQRSLTPQTSLHDIQTLDKPTIQSKPTEITSQPVRDSKLTNKAPDSLCSEKQLEARDHQLPRTKPLPSVESLGPPPAKPPKPPVVDLQIFQKQLVVVSQDAKEEEESYLPPESAEFEEPHNYEATISYPRHSGNSINLCTAEEITDSTYEVELPELQKPWKSSLHDEFSPQHEDSDERMKEKASHELESQKMEKDSHFSYFSKVGAWGKMHVTQVHRSQRNKPDEKQDARTETIFTKTITEDPQLARQPEGHGGYVEALEVRCETLDQEFVRTKSTSENTYDDVENPSKNGQKLDLSHISASDSEENGGEMYEAVYKTKSNYPKIDLDGKEALKRLQRFFKKVKSPKSKGNMNSLSVSMPDLEIRTQDSEDSVIIYDDVDVNEKESKDEDKQKTWKPKFFMSKEKKENKGAEVAESLSPRNFFRIRKQNYKKNKMEKEEKLFRERFEYNKEITVINTAVASSSNSRNGIFDLPISPGEQLEVIDITEENLVICRNSKGRYGYVLIEHLEFKHQGWVP